MLTVLASAADPKPAGSIFSSAVERSFRRCFIRETVARPASSSIVVVVRVDDSAATSATAAVTAATAATAATGKAARSAGPWW